ncbi:hypothetical protein CR513_46737, partial [Mucuna pruriens]
MPITRHQASSNNGKEGGTLQHLLQVVANLQEKSEEQIRLNFEDPHVHLQAFQMQVYISGGDDAINYKLFLGTLRGVAMQWFSNLPPRTIHTFNDLATIFASQFATNKAKRLEVANLFDIKQAKGKSFKKYLPRFNSATVHVDDLDQKFFVKAFYKGLRVGQFSDSLTLKEAAQYGRNKDLG